MKQITLRLPEDTLDELEAEAEERGVSRSEHIRDILDDRHRVEQLEARVDELETEVERQQRARRQLLEQREEHDELVAAVQEERSVERRRREAGVMTRAKWWLTGMPSEEQRDG